MPARGLTLRTKARMTGRHFRDTAEISVLIGIIDEVPQWEVIPGPFPCKLLDKSGIIYAADNNSQTYDAKVILATGATFLDPSSRYKITVTQYNSAIEGPDEEPEVKRVRYLEFMNVESAPDNIGSDMFQVLRCKNGPSPTSPGG